MAACGLLLASCGHKLPVSVPPDHLEGNLGYVDLQPGWRLRVVVPILRSGGYTLPMIARAEDKTVAVSTGKDFIGYETDYYAIQRGNEAGIRMEFSRAELVEGGKSSRRAKPILQVFRWPSDLQFARLVYLIRESQADHDLVLVAAADQTTLSQLTAHIMSDATAVCADTALSICRRIPKGVAVIPEQRRKISGMARWGPVF